MDLMAIKIHSIVKMAPLDECKKILKEKPFDEAVQHLKDKYSSDRIRNENFEFLKQSFPEMKDDQINKALDDSNNDLDSALNILMSQPASLEENEQLLKAEDIPKSANDKNSSKKQQNIGQHNNILQKTKANNNVALINNQKKNVQTFQDTKFNNGNLLSSALDQKSQNNKNNHNNVLKNSTIQNQNLSDKINYSNNLKRTDNPINNPINIGIHVKNREPFSVKANNPHILPSVQIIPPKIPTIGAHFRPSIFSKAAIEVSDSDSSDIANISDLEYIPVESESEYTTNESESEFVGGESESELTVDESESEFVGGESDSENDIELNGNHQDHMYNQHYEEEEEEEVNNLENIDVNNIPNFQRIDLHGYKYKDAKNLVESSIKHARENNIGIFHFITGIGNNSINSIPILRPMVMEVCKCLNVHAYISKLNPGIVICNVNKRFR